MIAYDHATRTTATRATTAPRPAVPGSRILELQRLAGNRAVAAMLAQTVQRDDEDIYDEAGGGARKAPPKKVTGYLGLNPQARKEASALKGASKEEVLVSLNDPEAEKKFRENPAIYDFVADELGISPLDDLDRWEKATDTLIRADPHLRDQLADMMRWFNRAELGEVELERIVLSGHSNGVEVWGDSEADAESQPGKMMVERDLASLAAVFPKATSQVQDIMFSACFSIASVELVIRIFPNLKTCWSYGGFSPDIAGGSGGHIAAWAAATEGEGTLHKTDKRGSNALWTRADGYIVGDPAAAAVGPLYSEVIRKYRELALPMINGERDVPKPELDAYYLRIQELSVHPGADKTMREQAEQARDYVLRLRFWPKIAERFGNEHGAELKPAYDALGVAPPTYAALTRVALKKHLDAVNKAIEAHPDQTAAKEVIDRLLKKGLAWLNPSIIKSEWI